MRGVRVGKVEPGLRGEEGKAGETRAAPGLRVVLGELLLTELFLALPLLLLLHSLLLQVPKSGWLLLVLVVDWVLSRDLSLRLRQSEAPLIGHSPEPGQVNRERVRTASALPGLSYSRSTCRSLSLLISSGVSILSTASSLPVTQ